MTVLDMGWASSTYDTSHIPAIISGRVLLFPPRPSTLKGTHTVKKFTLNIIYSSDGAAPST
jgi:hypothetical protein